MKNMLGFGDGKKTKNGINPESKSKAAKDRPAIEWVSHNGSTDIRDDF